MYKFLVIQYDQSNGEYVVVVVTSPHSDMRQVFHYPHGPRAGIFIYPGYINYTIIKKLTISSILLPEIPSYVSFVIPAYV